MNDQDLQKIIEQAIKETALVVNTSTKKENSSLYSEIKNTHNEILGKLASIDDKFKVLNGSVAKHNDKLAQHDVINAQTTISQVQIMDSLKELRAESKGNTDFRLQADGSLATFKWLFGFLGAGNVAMIIKIFLL